LDLRNLSSLAFVSGLLAVILYRFIRVSRDEQRAAGELEAARTVQQVLIPEELPAIPGYTIASVYRPAQQVGGDFFQVLPLPAGSPGEPAALIVLGDVSGKGLQAAMTVAVLVGALRTLAEFTQSPGELLSGLNRRLYGRSSGFTTCIILRIACSGEVIAANAGHLQPYQAGRELELESGLPLGLIPDATYPEGEFTLAPGESLTLLTDGVVEATAVATRELFGFERTQAISRQAANAIAEAARAFGVGAPQADDITVLTVARTAA
jgi:serine phosphatase RsbU (regulator of sigma subunit)